MKLLAIVAAILLTSSTVFAESDVGSGCTEGALTILSSEPRELPSEIADPVLVDEHGEVRITIGQADAFSLLETRKSEVRDAAQAVDALMERLRREGERKRIVTVKELHPSLESLPHGEKLQAGIRLVNEIMVLVLRSLRDGLAAATVRGTPVRSVNVQYYEARDETGKTNGVRIVAKGVRLYDYCATDPSR